MFEIIDPLIVILIGVLSIVFLGLVASFSPTLYITQIAINANAKYNKAYNIALVAGVLLAIFSLSFLFQIINLQTLLDLIDSTIHALVISVIFNILVAIGLILGGFWYINQDEKKVEKVAPLKETHNAQGIFWLAYARTFGSLTGITATYLASSSISLISTDPIERLILTAVFLFAAILPFMAISLIMKRQSAYITSFVENMKRSMKRFNYRLTLGVIAIILGCSIFILQIMTTIFY